MDFYLFFSLLSLPFIAGFFAAATVVTAMRRYWGLCYMSVGVFAINIYAAMQLITKVASNG